MKYEKEIESTQPGMSEPAIFAVCEQEAISLLEERTPNQTMELVRWLLVRREILELQGYSLREEYIRMTSIIK